MTVEECEAQKLRHWQALTLRQSVKLAAFPGEIAELTLDELERWLRSSNRTVEFQQQCSDMLQARIRELEAEGS